MKITGVILGNISIKEINEFKKKVRFNYFHKTNFFIYKV